MNGLPHGDFFNTQLDKVDTVLVTIRVLKRHQQWFREDTRIILEQEGVIGNSFLKIIPGSETSPVLEDGAVIPLDKVGGVKELIQKMQPVKEHLGMGDQADLEAARILIRTGRDCPGVPVPAPDSDASVHTLLHEKDLQYQEMIAGSRFKALSARLMAESDPLYASVYGRKAALAALRSGQADQTEALILQTRDLDARQGWVVFLIQDWKILHDLTKDSDRKEEILQRIEKLEDLVQPCTP